MDLLRFTTAGSVDDGKSTLIGRLLYDTKSILDDQLELVKKASEKKGMEVIDFSLFTDGLKAEREQGITIDVAYRYFSTPKRKFIIADTPGHIQYTRNMVTGASTANLALLLIDARKGITEQTCRHAFIASLLRIPHLIICINKMDLIDFDEKRYDAIVADFKNFSSKLEINDIHFVPVSALLGDNITSRSQRMSWFQGSHLLYLLENVHIASDENFIDCRFPVQYVVRPGTHEHHDYRGYAGRIAGGIFKPGDEVVILPSGVASKIKTIENAEGTLKEAFAPMSVTLTLEHDIDTSRGDMIVRSNNQPQVSQDLEVMLCWLGNTPLVEGTKYFLKHTTTEAMAIVKEVLYKIDINTLHRQEHDTTLSMNDFGRVRLRVTRPLFYDSYRKNRSTGSLILVDQKNNETVGAGIIL